MTIKELQHFLGFENFYISGLSSIATPITDLLKKGPKHLKWNQAPRALQAFHCLGEHLWIRSESCVFSTLWWETKMLYGGLLLKNKQTNNPWQSGTMTSETISYWQLSWPWKSGTTSWKAQFTHSLYSLIIRIWNLWKWPHFLTLAKPNGLCSSPGPISHSCTDQVPGTQRPTPCPVFSPLIHRTKVMKPYSYQCVSSVP